MGLRDDIEGFSITNNINVNVNDAELKEAKQQLVAVLEQADRLKTELQASKEQVQELTEALAKAKAGKGIDILEAQLKKFETTTETSEKEFRAFLETVNLLDHGWDKPQSEKLNNYFESIRNGCMTANQAIAQFKLEFAALLTENYNSSGGLFDSQTVQQFTVALDRMGETLDLVVQKLNTFEHEGIKSSGTGSDGNNIVATLEHIEKVAAEMSEEARAAYAPVIELVNAVSNFANIDSTNLLGVGQAFKNIADIGKGSFGAKSVDNIVYLTKQLQALSANGGAIRFDFTGLNGLKVSKASLRNLAEYLPQIASVDLSKIEKLARIDFSNLNNIHVSKASLEGISELATAIQGIREINNVQQNLNSSGGSKNTSSSKITTDEQALKRLSDTAVKTRELLNKNIDASTIGNYNELREILEKLDSILEECGGDASKLGNALLHAGESNGVTSLIQKTETAMAVMRNSLSSEGIVGSASLRNITDIVAQMQRLINANDQIKDTTAFTNLNAQLEQLKTIIELCEGDSEKLEQVLRVAGLNGTEVLENAKLALAGFKNEVQAMAPTVSEQTKAYNEAINTVKEYYRVQSDLKGSKYEGNDIALVNGKWTSQLSEWQNLASELNRLQEEYNKVTSSADKAGVSEEQFAKILELVAVKTRELNLAQEAQANKSANTEAVKAQAEAYNEAKIAIEQFFKVLSELHGNPLAEGDVSFDRDAQRWISASGDWNTLVNSLNNARESFDRVRSAEYAEMLTEEQQAELLRVLTEASEKYRRAREGRANAEKSAASNSKEQSRLDKEYLKLMGEMQAIEEKYTAAKHGRSARAYEDNIRQMNTLQDSYNKYKNGSMGLDEYNKKVEECREALRLNRQEIVASGEATKSFGDRVKNLAGKFSYWFSITRVIMLVVRTVRRMISTSIELDSAMTQLQVVTQRSEQTMKRFGEVAAETSKKIGANINDFLSSATTYARLGYSLEESSQLAEYTAMLQKVGNIDTSEAQDAITAIIKAFDVDTSQIESVMDKLITTGNHFPISVSQIAEGMNNASSTLAAAGNTFEQSVALLTAANTTVQDAAKASTGLRTIAARIRNTKTDLEALGEDMTEANYDELVKKLTGLNIALTDINGDYRSTYDIMSDIASKWQYMTSMEQAAVATALSGTRQQAIFYSIIEQFQEASGAMDAMANSTGALETAYATVMDSAEAHINQFKAAFQEFSADVFSSETISFVTDLGSGILWLADCLAKVDLLLPAIVTTIVAIKAIGLLKSLNAMSSKVSVIAQQIVREKGVTDALATSIANLTLQEKNLLKIQLEAMLAGKELNNTERAGVREALELLIADKTLEKGNHKLALSFKEVQSSIPVFGVVLTIISLIISFIPMIIDFANSFKTADEKIKESTESLKEMASEVKSTADEFRNLKQSFDDVVPRFVELAKGVNALGEKADLTDDEYKEFLELNNKIAEMFPELNLGMDINGNAMLALSYSADTLRESLDSLLETYRALANEKIADTIPDTIKNINNVVDGYDEQIKKHEKERNRLKDIYTAYITQDTDLLKEAATRGKKTRFETVDDAKRAAQIIQKEFENLGINLQAAPEYTPARTAPYRYNYSIALDFDLDHSKEDGVVKNLVDDYINVEDKVIADIEKRQKGTWAQLNPALQAWLNTDLVYNEFDEQMQAISERLIAGLDLSDLYNKGYKTKDDITEYITNNILNPLFGLEGDVKDEIGQITDWEEQLNKGEIDLEEFSEKVKNAFKNLFSALNNKDLEALFITVYSAMLGLPDDSDLDAVLDALVDNLGRAASAAEEFTAQSVSLSDAATKTKSAFDAMSTAVKEMNDASGNGGLSVNTIKTLADETENYLDYLYVENGLIKLNTEAWREYSTSNFTSQIDALQEEIELLKQKREELLKMADTDDGTEDRIEDIERIGDQIEDAERKLQLFRAMLSQTLSEFSSVDIFDFSSLTSELNSVENGIGNIVSAMDELRKGTALTTEEMAKLALQYPEMLKQADLFTDGSIEGQDKLLQAILENYENEYKANIDTKIAELKAEDSVLQKQEELEQKKLEKVIELTELECNGKLDTEEDYNTLLSELRDLEGQNYVSYSDGVLKVNQDALQKELGQMSDKVDKSKPLFEAQGNLIAESHEKGLEKGLENYPRFTNALKKWYEDSFVSVATRIANSIKKAVSGEDPSSATEDGTDVKFSDLQREYYKGLNSLTYKNKNGITLTVQVPNRDGMTIDGKSVAEFSVDYTNTLNKRLEVLETSRTDLQNTIANLEAMKELNLKDLYMTSHKGGGDDDDVPKPKEVEEYIAKVERYNEALQKLADLEKEQAEIEYELENATNNDRRLDLYKQLPEIYRKKQDALHELNNLRDATIHDTVATLEANGFEVEYDDEKNRLFIRNLEHINELTAKNAGEYETIEEATNALRKNMEELIDDAKNLNSENEKSSEEWLELAKSIKEVNRSIFDTRMEISENWLREREVLGWQDGDTEVKARQRILDWISSDYYKSLFDNEQEWKEIWLDNLEKYDEAVMSSIDKAYNAYSDYITEINDGLENQKAREQGLLDIKNKQFDATNRLAEAQHNADKAIAASRISKDYLSASEYNRIYNEKDYKAISNTIDDIDSAVSRLTADFSEQINNAYKNGQEYLIETITAEYERQVELKMQELDIAEAELDLVKKQTELQNVLAERNIRQMVEKDGKLQWEWVADVDKVRSATEELADAEYEHKRAVEEREQQIYLNKLQENIDNFTDEQGRNNKLVEQLGDSVDNVKKTIDDLKNPIGDLSTDIDTFRNKGVAGFASAVDEMIRKMGSFSAQKSTLSVPSSGGSSSSSSKVSYNSSTDYMAKAQEAISKGNDAAAANYLAQRNAKIDGEGLSYKKESLDEVKKKMGYASGTTHAARGWKEVDEDGGESYIAPNGTFHNFEGGEYVFDNEQTRKLWELSKRLSAHISADKLSSVYGNFGVDDIAKAPDIKNTRTENSYAFGDIVIQNPANFDDFTRQLINTIHKKTV